MEPGDAAWSRAEAQWLTPPEDRGFREDEIGFECCLCGEEMEEGQQLMDGNGPETMDGRAHKRGDTIANGMCHVQCGEDAGWEIS